jgi:MinD superfamily P-loop ATPase
MKIAVASGKGGTGKTTALLFGLGLASSRQPKDHKS